MLRTLTGKVLLLLVIFQVTGCGFALRGSDAASLPPELQRLYLSSDTINRDFSQELRRSLTADDVTLLENPEPGAARLAIAAVLVEERVISVTRDARAGEYELTLSVTFSLSQDNTSLLNDGRQTLDSQTLSISRVYLADPNNAAAKAAESELILNEMRRDLVRQVLGVLRSV